MTANGDENVAVAEEQMDVKEEEVTETTEEALTEAEPTETEAPEATEASDDKKESSDETTEPVTEEKVKAPLLPAYPGYDLFRRIVEKDVIRHSLTKFLVVSDITSADLFKAPLKDVILNAGKFHVFAGSPDTVKIELQYADETEANKFKDKINKSKLGATVENANTSSLLITVKSYRDHIEVPEYNRAQVLVAYGLTEATFNEDNQTIAETFTGIKTYLGDKDKRWVYLIYESEDESILALDKLIEAAPVCEEDWPMRIIRLPFASGVGLFDSKVHNMKPEDLTEINKTLEEIGKIEGDIPEEKQKLKELLDAKLRINKHFQVLRSARFLEVKKQRKEAAAAAKGPSTHTVSRTQRGRVGKPVRGGINRGAMRGAMARGAMRGAIARGAMRGVVPRGAMRGGRGGPPSARGAMPGSRGAMMAARGAPFGRGDNFTSPRGRGNMRGGPRPHEAHQAERTLDLLLDISTALHSRGGPPRMSNFSRGGAQNFGAHPYGGAPRGRGGDAHGRGGSRGAPNRGGPNRGGRGRGGRGRGRGMF